MTDHPLSLWLDAHGLKPWKFADQHGMARRTIYALVGGENLNPSIGLLDKIAAATDGAVTVQAQSDWAISRKNIAQHLDDDDDGAPPVDEPEDPDDAIDDDADNGELGSDVDIVPF